MFYFISSNGMLDLMGVAGLLVLSVFLLWTLLGTKIDRDRALEDFRKALDIKPEKHVLDSPVWKGDRPSDYASYASVRKSPHVAELVLNGSADRVQIPEKDPEAFERYLDLP